MLQGGLTPALVRSRRRRKSTRSRDSADRPIDGSLRRYLGETKLFRCAPAGDLVSANLQPLKLAVRSPFSDDIVKLDWSGAILLAK
jgi:hypothetical protein